MNTIKKDLLADLASKNSTGSRQWDSHWTDVLLGKKYHVTETSVNITVWVVGQEDVPARVGAGWSYITIRIVTVGLGFRVTMLSIAVHSTMVWCLFNSEDQSVVITSKVDYGENKNTRSPCRWDFWTNLACLQRHMGSVVPLPSNRTIHRVTGLFPFNFTARNFIETVRSNEVVKKPGLR